MSGMFHLFKPKDKAKKSGEEDGEVSDGGRLPKLNSHGSVETTLLVNDTDKTLVLRDKVGAAYGAARYKIPGKSEVKVTKLQHTFYRMIAYAVEEDDEEEEEAEVGKHSSHEGHSHGSHKKKTKKGVDTKLSIDSDQLTDYERVVISWDGLKYNVHFDPRR